jgi:Amt family ammonium transporter
VIKKVYGLRVTEHEEDAGLDISEHGMYGYPEQFIPQGEFPGAATSPTAAASAATAVRPAPNEA